MALENPKTDRVNTLIAVLIAIISVVAALGAWRVAVATSKASDADTTGLLAAVDREDSITEAYINLYGHLNAYSRAVAQDAIANALKPVEDSTTDANLKARLAAERDGLIYSANSQRFSIPQQYLDRNQNFDQARDVGETIAGRALEKDTFPEPHFQSANTERAKAEWLLLLLVLLGVAFVLLTLADALRYVIRYLFILLAVLILGVVVVAGVGVELFGAPALVVRF